MMRSHKTRPPTPRKSKALSGPAAAQKAPGRKKASAASARPARVEKKGPKLPKARPKLVRDSFTMPESDFGLIEMLKARALVAQRAAKKSELLRAGLRVLAALEVQALVAALEKLEPVKTGRPKKRH